MLVLDVAHNPHAVATLARNLDQMVSPRTHAVFGAMRDKDLAAILLSMAPLVDAWRLPICRDRGRRAATRADAPRLGTKGRAGLGVLPSQSLAALAAALANVTPLIESSFGSFTVGGV